MKTRNQKPETRNQKAEGRSESQEAEVKAARPLPVSGFWFSSRVSSRLRWLRGRECCAAGADAPPYTRGQVVEPDVDDWCCVEGQELADEEAADDGDAEGVAQLGAGAAAEGQGQSAE